MVAVIYLYLMEASQVYGTDLWHFYPYNRRKTGTAEAKYMSINILALEELQKAHHRRYYKRVSLHRSRLISMES